MRTAKVFDRKTEKDKMRRKFKKGKTFKAMDLVYAEVDGKKCDHH